MKITAQRVEKYGFTIRRDKHGFELSQYTPAGEDWNLYFSKLQDLKEYAQNFDPEEEFTMWIEAKKNGVSGVPGPAELWQDQLWKQNLLLEIIGG